MTIGNIILLGLLVVLIIAWPILTFNRNKKEQEKQKQLISSLKKGEYVLTYSGIFGKILEIKEKEVGKFVVIETGETHKNCVTVSENAIYMIVNNNPKVFDMEGNVVKTETTEVASSAKTEEPKLEIAEDTRVATLDKKPTPKTATKKSISTKKSTTKKTTTAKKPATKKSTPKKK